MNTDMRAFLFSLLLHGAVVGSAVSFAGVHHLQEKPILIDFTIENAPVAEQDIKRSNPEAPSPNVAAAPQERQVKAQPVTPAPPPPSAPGAVPVPRHDSPAAVPVAAAVAAPAVTAPMHTAKLVTDGTVSPPGTARGAGTGNGTTKGSGADSPGNVSKGESTETQRTRYLRKHFDYIQGLVAGNARYPGLARRMGWSGQVLVEFMVEKNGSVDGIRVVKSSGVPLLDSDAKDSVIRSAPFPKPPVSAKLVIPVEYKLEK